MAAPQMWTHADREALRSAYREGGIRRAVAVFPQRDRVAIGSAVARYCKRGEAPAPWRPSDVAMLLDADRAGGVHAAIAAFPDRSVPAVESALRRYRGVAPIGDPVSTDRSTVREKLAAIPFEQFIDRLVMLMFRRSDFEAAP